MEEITAEITTLYADQLINENKILHAIAATQVKDRASQGYLTTRRDQLQRLWTEYENRHNQIMRLTLNLEQNEMEEISYIKEDKYGLNEELCMSILGDIEEKLTQHVVPTRHSTFSTSAIFDTNSIRLPRIDLPTFSGAYDKWRSFHDTFVSMVHTNSSIPNVQKLHYLKSCVTGEAATLLRHYQITNDNYDAAWNTLMHRYDNKKVLINAQLNILFNLPTVTSESAAGIKNLLDKTAECVNELQALKVPTDKWDIIIIYMLIQRLPSETHRLWEQESKDTEYPADLGEFLAFLECRFRTLETISKTKSTASRTQPHNTKSFHTMYTGQCKLCKGLHFIHKCDQYLKADIQTRRQFVKNYKLCYNCLSDKHGITNCKSKYKCSVCNKAHHSTLHSPNANNNNKAENSTVQANVATKALSAEALSTSRITTGIALLATALVQIETPKGKTQTLRALIDPGSQISLITKRASSQLGLKGKAASLQVMGVGQTPAATSSQQVDFHVYNKDGEGKFEVNAFILPKITDHLPSTQVTNTNWSHITQLPLTDPTYYRPGQVDMILGSEIYSKIILDGIKKGPKGSPTAQNTKLGWILFGQTDATQTLTARVCNVQVDLNDQLKKFWEIEDISEDIVESIENVECEKFYKDTTIRLSDGKYQVRLPFKNLKPPELGESKHIAARRLCGLEQRFTKNDSLKREYSKCVNEYLQLGHMRKISQTEAEITPNYYIPHHAVFKESTITKLRVVFDASSKTSNRKSLNEQLLIGPTIQDKLFSIIMRWRMHKFAFTADIEKMYRQIFIHPEDRKFHRILWRDNQNELIHEFELNTVTFGTASAPFLAVRTLHQLAEDEGINYPKAASILKQDAYVDDIASGCDTIEEAIDLQMNLINLLKTGGFNLRKWASNCPELLAQVPESDREISLPLDIIDSQSIKTLGIGIVWHPVSDIFTYKIKCPEQREKWTKGLILSEIAKLFDPLGWISPIIISAKILIQKLWTTKCDWDEQIPLEIKQEWMKYVQELYDLETIKIPRWVHTEKTIRHIEIHGFADASIAAYAAVIYLRIIDNNEQIYTTLITSKTRVAPLKTVSLPRLELCGALLAAQLIVQVRKNLHIEAKAYAWTDSMITIDWIKLEPKKLDVFVGNRVSKIQRLSDNINWNHISSKHNPADCASRGMSANNLINFQLWWQGPEWLKRDQRYWPINGQTLILKCFSTLTNYCDTSFITKCSSFKRLCRIVCYVVRFLRCKGPTRNTGKLSVQEISNSESILIKLVQREAFHNEIKQLNNEQSLPKSSSIINLHPFICKLGFLRVGGRLHNSNLSYDEQHQIILPKHHFTNLLIAKTHLDTLHGGTTLTLATLRRKFWILDGKNSARSIIRKCLTCFKYKAAVNKQIMGILPEVRVNPARPFANTGVDFAGPFDIKTSTLRNAKITKGYACIFICLVTKAIHLELVSDMSSNAFLAALRRFISRRGLVSTLVSDNGTNFTGASKIIKREFAEHLNRLKEDIADTLTDENITWQFIPPASPNFGGLWEAGVKSMKYHLNRVTKNERLTFEEFSTLLTQIEAILNTRPLWEASEDPSDPRPLTAGHLLIGESLKFMPETNYLELGCKNLNKWQHIQMMKQHFWKRWSKEYLNTLQQRTKWKTMKENIKIGDLVIIKDDNQPPGKWLLGRISNTYPGRDGLVRVADIKTATTEMRRPISKICIYK